MWHGDPQGYDPDPPTWGSVRRVLLFILIACAGVAGVALLINWLTK